MTEYLHRPWHVAAIQWTGNNFADVEKFFAKEVGPTDDVGPYNEPDEFNMVQFYAWGDDQEVDPGDWIVIRLDAEDKGWVMTDEEFRASFTPRATM